MTRHNAPMKQPKIDLTRICKPSINMDWVRVYEESFPPEELWPVDMLCADVETGKKVLHTTENSGGRTMCFTLIAPFEHFIWADYIGVDKEYQSRGIAFQHISELLKICRLQYPSCKGFFFATESLSEPGINASTLAVRTRRQNLWAHLGAKHTPAREQIYSPNCIDPNTPLHIMELRWFELHGPITSSDLQSVISQVYRDHFRFKAEMLDSMISQFQPQ